MTGRTGWGSEMNQGHLVGKTYQEECLHFLVFYWLQGPVEATDEVVTLLGRNLWEWFKLGVKLTEGSAGSKKHAAVGPTIEICS